MATPPAMSSGTTNDEVAARTTPIKIGETMPATFAAVFWMAPIVPTSPGCGATSPGSAHSAETAPVEVRDIARVLRNQPPLHPAS